MAEIWGAKSNTNGSVLLFIPVFKITKKECCMFFKIQGLNTTIYFNQNLPKYAWKSSCGNVLITC